MIDCYVVFTQSRYKHWAMKYFNQNMSHCYVMIKSKGGHFWQIIRPTIAHVGIDMEFVEDYPHPRVYAGPEAVILPVRAYIEDKPRWGICVFTCTEVVKSVLGIKSFWTFTPWQLYKYLTRERKGAYHG